MSPQDLDALVRDALDMFVCGNNSGSALSQSALLMNHCRCQPLHDKILEKPLKSG